MYWGCLALVSRDCSKSSRWVINVSQNYKSNLTIELVIDYAVFDLTSSLDPQACLLLESHLGAVELPWAESLFQSLSGV